MRKHRTKYVKNIKPRICVSNYLVDKDFKSKELQYKALIAKKVSVTNKLMIMTKH